MRFNGKVALVTGSTRGIGYATAKIMARDGAKLVLSSRKADACERVLAEFRAAGHEAIAVPCHVGDADDRRRLVDAAIDAFGRIDVFVANAATNPVAASIQDLTDEVWDKILEVNLSSIWRFSKMILPQMEANGGGAMVAVSSIAALRPARVSAAYSVSKAAENHLVRNLADYWGPRGVRVNCVIPGATWTDMVRNVLADEKTLASTIAGIPLRRVGEPEDVGEAIAFLCSGAARQITGQMLAVDGGETMV
ncbi:MAG: SDR family oxidoreductase [Novosphingobium sp.]